MKQSTLRTSLYLFLLTLMSGCALLYANIEPPGVELDNIAFKNSGGMGMRVDLAADLRLSNPNDRALPVKGGRLLLRINNTEIATVNIDQAFEIPAYGSKIVTLPASLSIAKTLTMGFNLLNSENTKVDYALEGHIDMAARYLGRVPINKSGTVNWGANKE